MCASADSSTTQLFNFPTSFADNARWLSLPGLREVQALKRSKGQKVKRGKKKKRKKTKGKSTKRKKTKRAKRAKRQKEKKDKRTRKKVRKKVRRLSSFVHCLCACVSEERANFPTFHSTFPTFQLFQLFPLSKTFPTFFLDDETNNDNNERSLTLNVQSLTHHSLTPKCNNAVHSHLTVSV